MGFTQKQVQALRRNPDARYIRTREAHGRELSYLEGWYAISEANRIFGFDGWSRETIESRCVLARENRGAFLAVYMAKVRITVQADGAAIIREGHGTGEGRGDTPGEVHDTALKAAETDATKRALATFGRPFGLELYKAGRSERQRSPSQKDGQQSPARSPSSAPEPLNSANARSSDNTLPSPPLVPNTSNTLPATGHPKPAPSSPDSVAAKPAVPASGLPADHAVIPRPSRHFGRERYHETRQQNGALVKEAEQRALAAEVGAIGPHALSASPPPLAPPDGSLSPPPKIDKSVLTFGEPKRIRDKAHLRFVGSQPCLICGRQPADAHHLRFAQPRALGRKVSDEFTVPLCRIHHREVHQTGNEAALWDDLEIDALEIAKGLWEQSRGLVRPAQEPSNLLAPTEDKSV